MERYITDSGAKLMTTTLNHRDMNNGKKAVKANLHKEAGPKSPQHGEQRSNRDHHKAHGISANKPQ
eukprot:15179393-Ditylum_brightwellii.AAC.1